MMYVLLFTGRRGTTLRLKSCSVPLPIFANTLISTFGSFSGVGVMFSSRYVGFPLGPRVVFVMSGITSPSITVVFTLCPLVGFTAIFMKFTRASFTIFLPS